MGSIRKKKKSIKRILRATKIGSRKSNVRRKNGSRKSSVRRSTKVKKKFSRFGIFEGKGRTRKIISRRLNKILGRIRLVKRSQIERNR